MAFLEASLVVRSNNNQFYKTNVSSRFLHCNTIGAWRAIPAVALLRLKRLDEAAYQGALYIGLEIRESHTNAMWTQYLPSKEDWCYFNPVVSFQVDVVPNLLVGRKILFKHSHRLAT